MGNLWQINHMHTVQKYRVNRVNWPHFFKCRSMNVVWPSVFACKLLLFSLLTLPQVRCILACNIPSKILCRLSSRPQRCSRFAPFSVDATSKYAWVGVCSQNWKKRVWQILSDIFCGLRSHANDSQTSEQWQDGFAESCSTQFLRRCSEFYSDSKV